MSSLSSHDLALHCARIVDDKGGLDIALYRLPAGHALFDYALIVTGRSNRQVAAIVEEVLHFCKRQRIAHFPPEGESGWHLIDCYDVVVHALAQELRDFYRLERLWPQATVVDLTSALAELPRIEPALVPRPDEGIDADADTDDVDDADDAAAISEAEA